MEFAGFFGPPMVAIELTCIDIQVNDEYMRTLEILSKKLKFVAADPLVKTSMALKDVQPELERLRQKAVSKVVLALKYSVAFFISLAFPTFCCLTSCLIMFLKTYNKM